MKRPVQIRKLNKDLQKFRIKSVVFLSKFKLNNEQIGDVLGISREAVRKLLLRSK